YVASFVRRAVHGLQRAVQRQLVARRRRVHVPPHHREKVGPFGAVGLGERRLAPARAGGRDVRDGAVRFLEDAQRLHAGRALGPHEVEPEALRLTHVAPAHVEPEGHAVLAHDQPPRSACNPPRSPPARNPRTACTSERNRWFIPTITRRPYRSLAWSTRSTPASVSASGRSHSTWAPAARADTTWISCR